MLSLWLTEKKLSSSTKMTKTKLEMKKLLEINPKTNKKKTKQKTHNTY